MCGRANLVVSPEEIAETFGLDGLLAIPPRYNIAPSEPLLVVREDDRGRRAAAFLRWGLVRPGTPSAKAPINLRAESAAKGAMKRTVEQRRCLVPLSGFYEWRRAGKMRQPYNIRRKDGKVFGVAGLWERLESAGMEPLESCLVLTTAANEIVAQVHDRMPLILDPESFAAWLDPAPREPGDMLQRLVPLAPDRLESYPVSSLVNRAGVEDPRCLDRADSLTLW